MAENFYEVGSKIGKALVDSLGARDKAYRDERKLLVDEQYKSALAKKALGDVEKMDAEAQAMRESQAMRAPAEVSRRAGLYAGLPAPQATAIGDYFRTGKWGEDQPQYGEQFVGPQGMVPAAKPEFATPDAMNRFRDAALSQEFAFAAPGKTTGEGVADTITKLAAEARRQAAMGGSMTPQQVRGLNAVEAAGKGSLYNFHEFGTGDQGTGGVTFNSPYLAKTNAEIADRVAATDLKRAQTGLAGARAAAVPGSGQGVSDGPGSAPPAKPMPAAALKMQQEDLDAIGTASGINEQLAKYSGLIKDGKLPLGPVQNLVSKGRNLAGISNEGSQNFASLQATLEKLRNDSLRLNKGVQTEGDAVRAWNELMSNVNDPALVIKRIGEIQEINKRAVELRSRSINILRANYGHPELDVGQFLSGASGATPVQPVETDMARGMPSGVPPGLKVSPRDQGAREEARAELLAQELESARKSGNKQRVEAILREVASMDRQMGWAKKPAQKPANPNPPQKPQGETMLASGKRSLDAFWSK